MLPSQQLAVRVAAIEAQIGHQFWADLSMAEVIAAAESAPGGVVENWNA